MADENKAAPRKIKADADLAEAAKKIVKKAAAKAEKLAPSTDKAMLRDLGRQVRHAQTHGDDLQLGKALAALIQAVTRGG